MREYLKFYIDGKWVDPTELKTPELSTNPATEQVCGQDRPRLGGRRGPGGQGRPEGVCDLVADEPGGAAQGPSAHRRGIPEARRRSRGGDHRRDGRAERRSPMAFRWGSGAGHLNTAIEVLKAFRFEEQRGATLIVKEPIGVCGLITPWNWPMNQIAVKVFPALATGCTMVLKPSEVAPFSAQIFAEILHAAGVPAGVFNLIQGDGAGSGRGDVRPSRHRHDLLYRLHARWRRNREERRADGETGDPGARRQGSKHHSRRRSVRPQRRRGRCLHDGQFRPDLQRALAHARAQRPHGGSHPHCAGGRVTGDRGRPPRQFRDRSGGLENPVREDPGADPEGHR